MRGVKLQRVVEQHGVEGKKACRGWGNVFQPEIHDLNTRDDGVGHGFFRVYVITGHGGVYGLL